MASIEKDFTQRNCKLIGLSIDSVEDHNLWKKDIEDVQGASVNYPLIADENLNIAKLYNMLPADEAPSESRTAMTNATVRSVFLIDPEKKIRMMLTYPMTTGRNFEEIIRVLDSVQLTSKHKVATPANWKKNEKVIIVPAVSDDDAKDTFGDFEKIKPYLRYTKLDDS
jgi:alkyl hydroperoxide reductase subunit AhpC